MGIHMAYLPVSLWHTTHQWPVWRRNADARRLHRWSYGRGYIVVVAIAPLVLGSVLVIALHRSLGRRRAKTWPRNSQPTH